MLPIDTLRGILLEQALQQVVEEWTEALNLRRLLFADLRDEILEARSGVWRLASGKLKEHAAERPHVRVKRVDAIVSEQLRRHVVRRACLRRLSVALVNGLGSLLGLTLHEVGQLLGQAEVAQLERVVLVHEHIGWLQVAIDNAVGVQVVETLGKVAAKLLDALLRQLLVLLNELK